MPTFRLSTCLVCDGSSQLYIYCVKKYYDVLDITQLLPMKTSAIFPWSFTLTSSLPRYVPAYFRMSYPPPLNRQQIGIPQLPPRIPPPQYGGFAPAVPPGNVIEPPCGHISSNSCLFVNQAPGLLCDFFFF